MFKNFGTKLLLGFMATGISFVVIGLLIAFPSFISVLAGTAVISYAVGSLLFRLGFKFDNEGDLILPNRKKKESV